MMYYFTYRRKNYISSRTVIVKTNAGERDAWVYFWRKVWDQVSDMLSVEIKSAKLVRTVRV